ncbi:FH1/FH2 domain-containing protein 3 isoform X16 [Pteropus medius]|uniref:FH1/FH2 domain-containing protein 3 isoform X16 n=1 Tax=Pteropus vampyrus TaxID=132908 RepID=UPI00196B25F8|nr:FH1/FH2 domain-containing protein 3 isoform X16 [Pteropus giganteus]
MEDRGWSRALNEITSGKLLAQCLAHSEKGRCPAAASLPCIISGLEFSDWVPSLIGVSLVESGVASSQAWKEELDDCTLQLSHNGTYLDLEATLAEQRDELEGFQDDVGRGKKHSIILRTQLSVRVHACIEKLYNSSGRDLRRALFSLKQIFQDDKDLVHEFVVAEGLTCLIKVGAEADQNYQNYILRALGQIMLYVDGMNGVINHNETIQWLYTLIGSKFRLVVKTALKLLLVFVEYSESNAPLLIQAVSAVDTKRGVTPWSNIMEILEEKDGVDTELLVYAMTLVNKTLSGLPDQDTFYDVVDCLEELGIAAVSQRHLNKKGTDLDLVEQLNIYEVALRQEDGDETAEPPASGRRDRRRASVCSGVGAGEHRALDRRRSRRHSVQSVKSPLSAPTSPCSQSAPGFKPSQVRDLREKQHQESLAAERERRRQEREERLQRIEREERNKFSREYLDKREEQRQAREERYKYLEQLAAEAHEKEVRSRSASRGRADLSLDLTSPAAPASPAPLSPSPSSLDSQEALTGASYSPGTPQHFQASAGDPVPESEAGPEPEAEVGQVASETSQEVASARVGPDIEAEQEPEERSSLSEKERRNEEVNERDNCSASSISSSSSTLEREEKEDKLSRDRGTGLWSAGVQDAGINEQCGDILTNKRFMLDMLYAHNRKPTDDEEKGEGEPAGTEQGAEAVASLASRLSTLQANSLAQDESVRRVDVSCLDNRGSVKAFAEKFNSGDLGRGSVSPDAESNDKVLEKASAQPKTESDYIWDQLMANPRELRIQDMDFTDLGEEDDIDVLDVDLGHAEAPGPPPPPPPTFLGLPPPPPPPLLDSVPPPPVPGNLLAPPPVFNAPQGLGWPQVPRGQPAFTKKKKTIRLFWNEVRPFEWPCKNNRRCREFLWSKLEPIKVDTSRLEHLFESKSKELSVSKKTAADGKRQEIIVLDSKRSNAINIGLTVLPPPRTIKIAILNFDEYALNKEGIEKILTMIPTEEEKQKIQEAQLANPEVPLGSAEQFLLTLSSISELSARLHLWAFKMDYETTEKEVAEPLLDLKEGIDQLENNKTLGFILSTLLAIGNFLNGTNAKAFELSYLEKVPEVKDTVHKQSLLHHVCTMVVENFPDSSDLYSEIGAVTRSAKVDFDQLQDNLCQMERRCKASWDHLKAIAKHEMKPVLKQRMSEFLKDCAERIIILKIVHRRIINRFHSFLLFMGHPPYAIREVNINKFCRIISEFALEYRTTRERVLQQKQKRANHRERNKTRGKMITDSGKFSGSSPAPPSQPQGLSYAEDAAEHENMKAVLKTSSPAMEDATPVLGVRTRSRASRGSTGSWTLGTDDSPTVTDDAADEIMDRIVKSATQVPSQRVVPRERKRSRANRKSLRRTLKSGLTPEEARALGLVGTSELQL